MSFPLICTEEDKTHPVEMYNINDILEKCINKNVIVFDADLESVFYDMVRIFALEDKSLVKTLICKKQTMPDFSWIQTAKLIQLDQCDYSSLIKKLDDLDFSWPRYRNDEGLSSRTNEVCIAISKDNTVLIGCYL